MGQKKIFIFGAAGILLLLWGTWRILTGFRLNLYLLNHDSAVDDQSIIPISSVRKRGSSHAIFSGAWREDIEIMLIDHSNHSYRLRVGFHPWRGYCLDLPEPATVSLNQKRLEAQIRYPLRSGMRLSVNDREFEILVTRKNMLSQFPNEFRL